jgi:hypothetical protein
MIVGYARTSTIEQEAGFEAQLKQLKAAGSIPSSIGVPFSVARIPPGGFGSARCPTLNEPCLNATRAALRLASFLLNDTDRS